MKVPSAAKVYVTAAPMGGQQLSAGETTNVGC